MVVPLKQFVLFTKEDRRARRGRDVIQKHHKQQNQGLIGNFIRLLLFMNASSLSLALGTSVHLCGGNNEHIHSFYETTKKKFYL